MRKRVQATASRLIHEGKVFIELRDSKGNVSNVPLKPTKMNVDYEEGEQVE